MEGCMWVHEPQGMGGGLGTTWGSLFSLSTMWAPWINSKSLYLLEPPHQVQKHLLLMFHHTFLVSEPSVIFRWSPLPAVWPNRPSQFFLCHQCALMVLTVPPSLPGPASASACIASWTLGFYGAQAGWSSLCLLRAGITTPSSMFCL